MLYLEHKRAKKEAWFLLLITDDFQFFDGFLIPQDWIASLRSK